MFVSSRPKFFLPYILVVLSSCSVKFLKQHKFTLPLLKKSTSLFLEMNQADISKLVSQLRISVSKSPRKMKNQDGPKGRLRKLQKTVTALIKHERIELNYNRADEARGYVERLISEAVRHGDCHRTTMELADFWLLEKQLVHKLFKVLVPRFHNYSVSYTRFFRAPSSYPDKVHKRAVLELRGNPYPLLTTDTSQNKNLIHNVLLDEARKEYRMQKYSEFAEDLAPAEGSASLSPAQSAGTEVQSSQPASS